MIPTKEINEKIKSCKEKKGGFPIYGPDDEGFYKVCIGGPYFFYVDPVNKDVIKTSIPSRFDFDETKIDFSLFQEKKEEKKEIIEFTLTKEKLKTRDRIQINKMRAYLDKHGKRKD